MQKSRDQSLILHELVLCDVEVPINHLDEEGLQLIDVLKGDTSNLCDVLVGVVCVIEHLGGDQDCR